MAKNILRIGTTRAQAPVGSQPPPAPNLQDKVDKIPWYVKVQDPYCPRIWWGAELINTTLQHKIPNPGTDLPVHKWLKEYCETAKQYAQEVDNEGYRFYDAGAEASNALDSDEMYPAWSHNHVKVHF